MKNEIEVKNAVDNAKKALDALTPEILKSLSPEDLKSLRASVDCKSLIISKLLKTSYFNK